MPKINPKLTVYNVTVNVDGKEKKPGDTITKAQAEEYEGKLFNGLPLVVSGGKVKPESDED